MEQNYLAYEGITSGGMTLMWYRVSGGIAQTVVRIDCTGEMFYMEDIDRDLTPMEYIRWFACEDDGESGYSCGSYQSVLEALADCADPVVYWEARIECAVADMTEMNEVVEEMADDDRLTEDEYCRLYALAVRPFQMD